MPSGLSGLFLRVTLYHNNMGLSIPNLLLPKLFSESVYVMLLFPLRSGLNRRVVRVVHKNGDVQLMYKFFQVPKRPKLLTFLLNILKICTFVHKFREYIPLRARKIEIYSSKSCTNVQVAQKSPKLLGFSALRNCTRYVQLGGLFQFCGNLER